MFAWGIACLGWLIVDCVLACVIWVYACVSVCGCAVITTVASYIKRSTVQVSYRPKDTWTIPLWRVSSCFFPLFVE